MKTLHCVPSVQLRCARRGEGFKLSMDGITRLVVLALLACLHVVGASASNPSPSGRLSLLQSSFSKGETIKRGGDKSSDLP